MNGKHTDSVGSGMYGSIFGWCAAASGFIAARKQSTKNGFLSAHVVSVSVISAGSPFVIN